MTDYGRPISFTVGGAREPITGEAAAELETMTVSDLLARQRRQDRGAIRAFLAAVAAGDFSALADSLEALEYGFLWRPALAALVRRADVHPDVPPGFLRIWIRYGDSLRQGVGDDLALAAGLRLLMPPYSGPAVEVYRGEGARNRRRRTYGFSWSSSREAAEAHARGLWQTTDGGSVLLRATAPPSAIICAVPEEDDHYGEEEFLVDRRYLRGVEVVARFPQKAL
ncbi:hypothetical protein [Muricoccus nepalensis]|uniref:hypothetical protein n=1 Tax=Muricoccus nepalensis TaxID=1854500 RepID=UPI00112D4F84|nr:hypothetical protein [Roseomonas nepalensis]